MVCVEESLVYIIVIVVIMNITVLFHLCEFQYHHYVCVDDMEIDRYKYVNMCLCVYVYLCVCVYNYIYAFI